MIISLLEFGLPVFNVAFVRWLITYHSCSKPTPLVYVEILTEYFASRKIELFTVDREEHVEEPKWCTFENDTNYKVEITDKDGTRALDPGKSTTNCDIPAGSHVILVLKLPKGDMKIDFPSSGFNNSTYKISQIFANQMKKN